MMTAITSLAAGMGLVMMASPRKLVSIVHHVMSVEQAGEQLRAAYTPTADTPNDLTELVQHLN